MTDQNYVSSKKIKYIHIQKKEYLEGIHYEICY